MGFNEDTLAVVVVRLANGSEGTTGVMEVM